MLEVGSKVIAITDQCEAIKKGSLYVVENDNHHALGRCGLVKLKGVRDWWRQDNFIELTADLINAISQFGKSYE